jgi:hypothetical protein
MPPVPFISLVFFGLFALVIIVTFIAVRRQWGNLRVIAAACLVLSILTMSLALITRAGDLAGQVAAQMIFFGTLLGGVGGLAALVIAWYFRTQELRNQQ